MGFEPTTPAPYLFDGALVGARDVLGAVRQAGELLVDVRRHILAQLVNLQKAMTSLVV